VLIPSKGKDHHSALSGVTLALRSLPQECQCPNLIEMINNIHGTVASCIDLNIQNNTQLDALLSYALPDETPEVACISRECSGMYVRPIWEESIKA
jgi:hypothetical protein